VVFLARVGGVETGPAEGDAVPRCAATAGPACTVHRTRRRRPFIPSAGPDSFAPVTARGYWHTHRRAFGGNAPTMTNDFAHAACHGRNDGFVVDASA
jgi:hypothetical protein